MLLKRIEGVLMQYERKQKEERPVLAICYDFDKTLTPNDMQAQGYIQSVNYKVKQFWDDSNKMARDNDMDANLAYMFKMVTEAEGNFVFNKKALADYGAKVKLFPGVEDWFKRIKNYGKKHGVIVEHYIISSGLKEMIEGTKMAKDGDFEKVYASSFFYNERGVATWPAQAINYTNKTQFLFRIEKGVLDINDQGVNEYFSPEKIRVPFRNIVYIGDSETDIPCMKLVNTYGGHSIGVYDPDKLDKSKVYKMIRDNRINYYVPADYTEKSELDSLIKAIIDKTVSYERLEEKHIKDLAESKQYEKNIIIESTVNKSNDVYENMVAPLTSILNASLSSSLITSMKAFQDLFKNGISSIINSAFIEEDDLNQKNENEKPEDEDKENDEGKHQKN